MDKKTYSAIRFSHGEITVRMAEPYTSKGFVSLAKNVVLTGYAKRGGHIKCRIDNIPGVEVIVSVPHALCEIISIGDNYTADLKGSSGRDKRNAHDRMVLDTTAYYADRDAILHEDSVMLKGVRPRLEKLLLYKSFVGSLCFVQFWIGEDNNRPNPEFLYQSFVGKVVKVKKDSHNNIIFEAPNKDQFEVPITSITKFERVTGEYAPDYYDRVDTELLFITKE